MKAAASLPAPWNSIDYEPIWIAFSSPKSGQKDIRELLAKPLYRNGYKCFLLKPTYSVCKCSLGINLAEISEIRDSRGAFQFFGQSSESSHPILFAEKLL